MDYPPATLKWGAVESCMAEVAEVHEAM